MLDDLAMEYLSLSDKMRKGYKDSLGTESQTWNETLSRLSPVVPDVFKAIYGKVSGTYRGHRG